MNTALTADEMLQKTKEAYQNAVRKDLTTSERLEPGWGYQSIALADLLRCFGMDTNEVARLAIEVGKQVKNEVAP